MSLTLHLGEYSEQYEYADKTTEQVAEILEERYGLFSVFYQTQEQGIADDLATEMGKKLESLIAGKPQIGSPLSGIGTRVEMRFRKFLNSYEAEKVGIPGTPTAAAKAGVRHVGKNRVSGRRRPSFVDTGALKRNFRCWVSGL